jgi:hypothetical protein
MFSLFPRHFLKGALDEFFHSTCVDKASNEMPVYVNSPSNYTISNIYSKSVFMKTPGMNDMNDHNADRVGILQEATT